MATIFWDPLDVLLIDYIPHKTTISEPYYSALMDRLRESIKKKWLDSREERVSRNWRADGLRALMLVEIMLKNANKNFFFLPLSQYSQVANFLTAPRIRKKLGQTKLLWKFLDRKNF